MTSVLHFHSGKTIYDIYSGLSVINVKIVKQWLNLPCNCTPATVFHPNVLDLPFLPHFKESAKLSFILAIERSVDPLITELKQSLLTPDCQDVPVAVFDALSTAKVSVSNINSATFKNNTCKHLAGLSCQPLGDPA